MRICHVITRLIVGGAQENTLLTCVGLRERGHDVCLISGPEAGPEGSLLDEARAGGFEVRIVPTLQRSIRPLSDLRAWRELQSTFRTWRPDIVHTHSSKAGVLGRRAARNTGVPGVVHTIHGMSFNRTQPRLVQELYRRVERHCAKFTHQFICVADAMTRQAVAAGIAPADRFITVYSGMRTDWYTPGRHDREAVRQSWKVEKNQVVVGTIARLFRNKGFEQLIPAMAEAARRSPQIRFVWVGDGAKREVYERQLDALGLRSRVHLAGLVPPREVAPLIAGMDILVHASQWEGLPRAAVQAALMERPVISFNIDGAPEVIIPGQTGLLVPLNDLAGLSEAIVSLAEDDKRREALGQAARQRCLERFDHNAMVDQIEHLYRELIPHADS